MKQLVYCIETGEYWPSCGVACRDLGVNSSFFQVYFGSGKTKILDGLTFIKVSDAFCTRCGKLLTEENHPKWQRAHICSSCADAERLDYRRKQFHGISSAKYEDILKKQDNCCAICKKHVDTFKVNLAVDHCRETGKVRGLLCFSCNVLLGQCKDKPEILLSALNYLEASKNG